MRKSDTPLSYTLMAHGSDCLERLFFGPVVARWSASGHMQRRGRRSLARTWVRTDVEGDGRRAARVGKPALVCEVLDVTSM